jgi:hypothetical protein
MGENKIRGQRGFRVTPEKCEDAQKDGVWGEHKEHWRKEHRLGTRVLGSGA